MKTIDLKTGDSLENFSSKTNFKNPLVAILEERKVLITKITPEEASVLYRGFVKLSSKGYLSLENYQLESERIWSKDMIDYKDKGSNWNLKLKEYGI